MMRGLTHARLLEVLHYCPAIGAFWWKTRPDTNHLNRIHNSKFAKKMAGRRNSKGYDYLGTLDTPQEAHAAFSKRAIEASGSFARTG